MPDDPLGDWLRRAANATGRAALVILVGIAKAAEEYQNSPEPCAGCRRNFLRKEMTRLRDIPFYAERWWVLFCGECAERLHAAYEYEGILRDENRKVLAQLKRAINKGLPATLTLAQWVATLDRFGWLCAYCRVMPYEHIEHFVPIEHGGGTTADNCVPACKRCNSAKGVLLPDEIGESSRSPAAIARVRAYLVTQLPALPPLGPAALPTTTESETRPNSSRN